MSDDSDANIPPAICLFLPEPCSHVTMSGKHYLDSDACRLRVEAFDTFSPSSHHNYTWPSRPMLRQNTDATDEAVIDFGNQ
jgi:hypothetical protein